MVNQGESPAYGSKSVAQPRHRISENLVNLASWLLVLAFVALVLSGVAPAMTSGSSGDVVAALSFMVGLAAGLAGTGLSIAGAQHRPMAVLGGLILLVGLVGLYGLIPTVAALAVVLLGVAIQISSLPPTGRAD